MISNGRSYKGDIEIAPFEPDDEDTLVEAGLLTAATEKGKACSALKLLAGTTLLLKC